MGTVHKLYGKIRDFIISHKQANPQLSCRRLSQIIHSRFRIHVSKSSISAILKQANLSSAVGRPKKPSKALQKPETLQIIDSAGCIFLKAAEIEAGVINAVAELICGKFPHIDFRSLKMRSELLTFLPVFGLPDLAALQNYSGQGLWSILGRKYKYSFLGREIDRMPNMQPISDDIVREIKGCLDQIDYVKITLSQGDIIYLDPQFKTLWPSTQIPQELSITINKAKSYVDSLFMRNAQPIILESGWDFKTSQKYFLDFILSLEAKPQKKIVKISLLRDNQEVERFTPDSTKKRHFIVGFMPRQIQGLLPKKAWEFKKISLNIPEKWEVYADALDISITQYPLLHNITLNICLIKQNPSQDPTLCLLSNYSAREKPWYEIVRLYFKRWPRYFFLEEPGKGKAKTTITKFIDSHNLLNKNKLYMFLPRQDLSWLYTVILETLNKYAQLYYFPDSYVNFDFPSMQERFYRIAGKFTRQTGSWLTELIPSPDFSWQRDFIWQKDLIFACQRLNQANIISPQKEQVLVKPILKIF